MRTGRPIPPLKLTDEERDTLERWARRPKTAQALAQRSRLILACATGKANTRVARKFGVAKQTVGKWRTRFVDGAVHGVREPARFYRSFPQGLDLGDVVLSILLKRMEMSRAHDMDAPLIRAAKAWLEGRDKTVGFGLEISDVS